ncbi:hypothetical protein [Paenibacillus taihuensis]|nr:hypothetical protein [Paenibacillus taihuensis]
MLRNQAHFNPFSDKFDSEKISKDLETYRELKKSGEVINDYDPDDFNALNIIEATPLFNAYFKQLYDYMKDAINKTQAHPENIIKYLVAIVNSQTSDINREVVDKIENINSAIRLEEIATFQVHSAVEGNPINAIGAFEIQIDLLNILINYLVYFLDIKGLHDNFNEDELEHITRYMFSTSNVLCVVKDSYDIVTWEDGRIVEMPNNEIHLKYKDDTYPVLQRIGLHRIERNVLASKVEFHNIYLENSRIADVINLKRKKAVVTELRINNRGFIDFQISKTTQHIINEEIITGLAAIVSFYPHINLEPLKNLNRLNIQDLIILYGELLSLSNSIENIFSEQESIKDSKLKCYLARIKKKELISYLQNLTTYSKAQIESFLTVIESDIYLKKSRINLWSRPLLKTRDVYFFILPALKAPNYLQMIDEWLESAQYSLKDRGTALEKLIKSDMVRFLASKGSYAIVPQKQKFILSKKESEEIDLIVSMEKMVFIAEIKNIKFPMEPRDYHNGYKRLKEGAEQVLRKRDFILRNASSFEAELNGIRGKQIHVAVICNYPHFTGIEIDGVPVIDYMVLQTYMNKGEITDLKVEFNEDDSTDAEIINTKRIWTNIDDFYNNFGSYLKNPTIIEQIDPFIELGKSRITMEEADPRMFMQVAEFSS